jgi:hypothetical protein
MAEKRNDDKGYERGAKGFGTDKGFSPATTVEAGKKLYGTIMPKGKVMEGSGEPMPSGSAAGKGGK